ncbi:hypothetical protein ABZS77_01595 [Micromonospora sp. NPDC005298]|uniref:hypothetical protein n=1 Tax=Micromonospora sp. NPDC005298 TaxID=3156873 RepID=UPI0033B5A2E9
MGYVGPASGEGVTGRVGGQPGDVTAGGAGRLAGGSGVGDVSGVVAGSETVALGAGVVAGVDRVALGTAVAVDEMVSVGVGPAVGVGVGSGGSVRDGTGVGVGLAGGEGTTGLVLRVGPGTGGSPRSTCRGSTTAGGPDVRRGAAGSQPGVAVGPALGVPRPGGTGRPVAGGGGSSTGPTDGVGMNGVLLSGSAVLPGVADPALIAARMGIDAVPASSATVSR